MNKAHLLIEIGCEELPPKSLAVLQNHFVALFCQKLTEANLRFEKAEGFSTPRRLAIRISNLLTVQPEKAITRRGPAKSAAFDEKGQPTPAMTGFLKSCGASLDALSVEKTDKGEWLVFKAIEPGQKAEDLIPALLTETLNTLPMGRKMRWGDRSDSFSRPIHWIVLLLNNTVIPGEFFGIKSDRITYGHRFHAPHPLSLQDPLEYESILLNKGYVIADFNERREIIKTKIAELTASKPYNAIVKDDLLEEVTGLVEWPVILEGSFDNAFLSLPKEVLMTTLETHQRCFAVQNNQALLEPYFVLVSNLKSEEPQTVISGNERVIGARLADAAFYAGVDTAAPLSDRLNDLKHIRFQQGLGDLYQKSYRIQDLALALADQISADKTITQRAALLSKTDLLTQMVGEFPELQGIMGYYYAKAAKEPDAVAHSIKEHLKPKFAEDDLPNTPEGAIIALADRIDSLVGIFGLGKKPTGDKDPFGLRRSALGVLKILIEKNYTLNLEPFFQKAVLQYQAQNITLPNKSVVLDLISFCFERLRALYHEKGINPRVFDAVLAKNNLDPADFNRRINAVNAFITLKSAESLAAANKRVHNILSKNGVSITTTPINSDLLKEPSEKNLYAALKTQQNEIAPLIKNGEYQKALEHLTALNDPIDAFFSNVMVMCEDEHLKNNRLQLLNQLRLLFLEIADISVL